MLPVPTTPQSTFQEDVESFSKDIERQECHWQDDFKVIADELEHDIRKQVELALR
jgi:hypothetical protein